MRKRNQKDKIIISIIIIFVFLILAYLIMQIFQDKKEIPVSFIVADKVGFDLDKESLTFGAIPPGGSGSRGISINNDLSNKVKVTIFSVGDTKDYLFISENDFILDSGEKKKIMFYANIPENAIKKKYEGKIIIIMKRKWLN